MTDYIRPFLYPKQERAIFCKERFSIIEASTKSGKTVGCIAWLIEQALSLEALNYWWCAPVSGQADIAYRRIKQFLTPGTFTAFASPWPRIELVNGRTIWIKSADAPDSLYGEDVGAAVGDEITRWKETAWHALRSTLTATRGPARLIGNVTDKLNFAYHLARKAQAGELPGWHYAKLTYKDAINAGVLDPEDIEDARRTLPENVFRALYLAEADEGQGNPFGIEHIRNCIISGISTLPPVAYGVDLAKKQDWLVVIGLDANGHVCRFFRWRDTPWRDSIQRIHQIIGEDVPTLVDSTGVGDPVLEELQVDHSNFKGYMFSLVGKQKVMEGLAVSIQGKSIGFPEGPIVDELSSFGYNTSPSGRVVYSAPDGYNDDCVCALALARNMLTENLPGLNLMQYMRDETGKLVTQTNNEPGPQFDNHLLWHELDREEIITNELTELYQETLNKLQPKSELCCHRCNKPVTGPTRVSDGEYIWHLSCAV